MNPNEILLDGRRLETAWWGPRANDTLVLLHEGLGCIALWLDVPERRAALTGAALEGEATLGASDLYGTRYIIDFELRRGGRAASIRSCWIVLGGEIAPRFVTCYIL